MNKNLVAQAKQRAQMAREQARERANRMYGGSADDTPMTPDHVAQERAEAVREAVRRAQGRDRSGSNSSDAVRAAVADASRRAANAARDAQTGGWLKGQTKTKKLADRVAKISAGNKSIKYTKGKKAGTTVKVAMPTFTHKGETKAHSIHSKRSFKATVNGTELTGSGKSGRYFHGEPAAAAKKVVSQLHKGAKGSVTGINKAVKIDLTEVTKGVRNAKGEHYEYHYFGWREDMAAKPKLDKNGQPMKDKNGKPITFTGMNKAIPVRKAKNAGEAKARSEKIGAKIMAKKQ